MTRDEWSEFSVLMGAHNDTVTAMAAIMDASSVGVFPETAADLLERLDERATLIWAEARRVLKRPGTEGSSVDGEMAGAGVGP